MDAVTNVIAKPLGYVMKWCWQFVGNYGLAIILFTLLTKIILLPLSVWIQKNSIKMVQIQPQLNHINAKNYGNPEAIADEQSKLFKEAKYRPLAGILPLVVQFVLLLGVVQVIYRPFDCLFNFPAEISDSIKAIASTITGTPATDNAIQLVAIRAIKDNPAAFATVDGSYIDILKSFNLNFCGLDISLIPLKVLGFALFIPVVAGLSSWLLCVAQNRSNVLQAEQSAGNKYGLMAFSVLLSLYLGFFVPAGIAVYWVASNLLAIVQLYALNAVIPPKKYVDYEALEESRRELALLKDVKKKTAVSEEDKKREKEDYKRFFSIGNKHLVFYSERSGFYKYYAEIIEYLLKKTNVTIHYITNDPADIVFEKAKEEPRLKPYYIGVKKMITLMMKMDANVVVMTTPDLDNFYIKRSIVKKDIEYIFVPHDPSSMHMGFKEHSLDNFDTVFCTGPHIAEEVRATEKYYGTKEKTLVEFGYPLIEQLISSYESQPKEEREVKKILIAPSWQEDNLLDSCIDDLIESLYAAGYEITVRPHPEYMKRYSEKMRLITERHSDKTGDRLTFELDFSSNKSVYGSDLLITDWSGIGIEFGFATLKPVIFVNTKIKMENPNYNVIGIEPQEIKLRSVLGVDIEKSEAKNAAATAAKLLSDPDFAKQNEEMRKEYFYNLGSGGKTGAKYIVSKLVKRGE